MNRLVIILLLLGAVSSYLLGRMTAPTVVVTEYQQEEIDPTLWVSRSSYVNQSVLIASLETEKNNLAAELRNAKGTILNYTNIVGTLNTTLDSLQNTPSEIIVIDGVIQDTTYTTIQTFGDSLFTVTADIVLNSNKLLTHLTLTQNRPIDIDIVTTQRQDIIQTFVRSEDFTELNFTTQHAIKPKRMKWYHWSLIGLTSGLLISTQL